MDEPVDLGEVTDRIAGRTVVLISPHFDDVPLSLGQSLISGALSRAGEVRVKVVFGRTNWTAQIHPTRRRAPLVTLWRRGEELLASRRFGYRVEVAGLEEVILRTGSMDPADFRGGAATDTALTSQVEELVRRWSGEGDETWVPAGLGDHVDHLVVAEAGIRLVQGGAAIGFYEDRPYSALVGEEGCEARRTQLGDDLGSGWRLRREAVSDPITASTQATVRRIYRSQMVELFRELQDLDVQRGAHEVLWRPVPTR